jgi:hypothetical protein
MSSRSPRSVLNKARGRYLDLAVDPPVAVRGGSAPVDGEAVDIGDCWCSREGSEGAANPIPLLAMPAAMIDINSYLVTTCVGARSVVTRR